MAGMMLSLRRIGAYRSGKGNFRSIHKTQWLSVASANSPLHGDLIESMIDRSNILWKKTTLPGNGPTVQYAEAQNGDEIMEYCIDHNLPEAFGIVSWESSINILPFVRNKVEELARNAKSSGRPVVVCDVGCGTGLLGVAALTFGADRVISLDYNLFSLCFAKRTYQRNLPLLQVERPDLNSGSMSFVPFDLTGAESLPSADLYLYSDVLYTEDLARVVANRVRESILKQELSAIYCIVADPKRSTAKAFFEELSISPPASVTQDGDGAMKVSGVQSVTQVLDNMTITTHTSQADGNERYQVFVVSSST